jgi:acyl-CoA reductase-like NAD-dependent aldehyde dehydrogenase
VPQTSTRSRARLIARANDTPYGFGASIWTRDVGFAHRLAAAVQAGNVWVNIPNQPDAATPWVA